MSFKSLKRDELYRSAVEDFAVDVEADASKQDIIAALVETGIEWKDYLAQHPEAAPTEPVQSDRGPVVSLPPSDSAALSVGVSDPAEKEQIHVAQPVVNEESGQWLVKMIRDNPLFEIAGHRFTQQHPYALVSSSDAEVILREDGFRQAFPSELEEFYA